MEVFSEVDGMVLKEDEVPRQTQGGFHFTSMECSRQRGTYSFVLHAGSNSFAVQMVGCLMSCTKE